MAKTKKLDTELLDRLASAITENRGGDVGTFLPKLQLLHKGAKISEDKAHGKFVRMAGIEGATTRLGGNAGDWEALVNWSNAARRAIRQAA